MVDKFQILGIQGINEELSPESLNEATLSELTNMVLDKQGSMVQAYARGGITKYNTNQIYASGDCDGLFDVTTQPEGSVGDRYTLALINGRLMKSLAGTGAFTDIKTGLPVGTKLRMAQANKQFFFTNGSSAHPPFVVLGDLTTYMDLEIERPDVSAMVITAGYTGADDALTLDCSYWWIMFYVTLTGEYSRASKPFTYYKGIGDNLTTETGVINKFTLGDTDTLPVSTDERVIGRVLFRSEGVPTSGGGTGIYYFHSYLNNIDTEFVDDKLDTELDTTVSIKFPVMPTLSKFIEIHRQRLWMAYIVVRGLLVYEPPVTGFGATYGFTAIDYGAGGGLLDQSAVYKYRLTIVDENGLESDYYETQGTTGASGSDDRTLTLVNIPHYAYNNLLGLKLIRIYRTVGGGSTFYWLADERVSYGTIQSYIDQSDDTTLLTHAQMVTDHSQIYTSGIMYSEIGKYSMFPIQNILNVDADDANPITGIKDDGNGLLIFRKESIYRLNTDYAPENWNVYRLTNKFGSTQDNILLKALGKYLVIYDKKPYFYFPGSEPQLIGSSRIVTFESVATWYDVIYYPLKGWYVIAVYDGSNYFLMCYDERVSKDAGETWYKFTITKAKALETVKGAGDLMIGVGGYVCYYDESATVDNDTGSNVTYSKTLTTKTFRIDGMLQYRLRKFFMNYYHTGDIVITLTDPNQSTVNRSKTITASTGWTDLAEDIENWTGTLTIGRKLKISITGAGLKIFNSMKAGYRVVRRIVGSSIYG